MVCSLIPKVKFPISSTEDFLRPRKSLVRGKETSKSFSRKPYILAPRRVTATPILSPILVLKEAIDFLACLSTGF